MGERKGQNMYYPPDYDPGKGGLNKSQGTHALRERARKLHLGILIIRFEMPYNIWCEGCGNHIGMGVRYVVITSVFYFIFLDPWSQSFSRNLYAFAIFSDTTPKRKK